MPRKTEKIAVFLDELAKETQDPLRIRAELLNFLLAGRDTTASLLGNAWFILAKSQDIWANLRAEVISLGSELPTFEMMKEMKYLPAFLKECKTRTAFNIPLIKDIFKKSSRLTSFS